MTDVFNEQQGNTSNSDVATSTPADQPTYDFIGEGKQYATIGDALASIPHKDTHIAKIEGENAQMRTSAAESKTLEDVISAVKTSGEQNVQPTPNTQGEPIAPLDVADVVKGVLQQERDEAAVQSNVAAANTFMSTTFGDKAVEVAKDKASELGLTLQGLQEIAVRSPAAYQALFATQQQSGVTTTHSDVNTQSHLSSDASGEAKYDEIRKKDVRHFLSAEVQKDQMAEAMSDPGKYFNS